MREPQYIYLPVPEPQEPPPEAVREPDPESEAPRYVEIDLWRDDQGDA